MGRSSRRRNSFWNALQAGLPMGFQAGMQDMRDKRYSDEREKDRIAREREEYRARQERSRIRTQNAQADETARTRGNLKDQRLVEAEFGKGSTDEWAQGAPVDMRGGSASTGIPSIPVRNLSGMGEFGDVLRRNRAREEAGDKFRALKKEEKIDNDAFQASNRNAFNQLGLLDPDTYGRQSYNVTVDYHDALGKYKAPEIDTSAADEAATIEGEKQAHTVLQRIYPEEWGRIPFNPAAAQRGHYTQSVKELGVAESRPETGFGSELERLLSGASGSSQRGLQGPPQQPPGGGQQPPPVIDTPLSDSELEGALALTDDLLTWPEKEQALAGLYGPNQLEQIKARVGG